MLQRRSYSPVCDESDPEAVCARQAAGVDNVLADELDVLGGALYRSEASRSGAAMGGGGGGEWARDGRRRGSSQSRFAYFHGEVVTHSNV